MLKVGDILAWSSAARLVHDDKGMNPRNGYYVIDRIEKVQIMYFESPKGTLIKINIVYLKRLLTSNENITELPSVYSFIVTNRNDFTKIDQKYCIFDSSDTKKYIAKCVKAGAVYHKGIELCITSEITKKVTYERIKYNI